MTMNTPFTPAANATLSVTTTSSSATIGSAGNGGVFRLYNSGAVPVFVRVSTSAPTAVVTDFAVPPTSLAVIGWPDTTTHIAAITASGTATLYVSRGEGGY